MAICILAKSAQGRDKQVLELGPMRLQHFNFSADVKGQFVNGKRIGKESLFYLCAGFYGNITVGILVPWPEMHMSFVFVLLAFFVAR